MLVRSVTTQPRNVLTSQEAPPDLDVQGSLIGVHSLSQWPVPPLKYLSVHMSPHLHKSSVLVKGAHYDQQNTPNAFWTF